MSTETWKGKTKRPPQLGCGLLCLWPQKGQNWDCKSENESNSLPLSLFPCYWISPWAGSLRTVELMSCVLLLTQREATHFSGHFSTNSDVGESAINNHLFSRSCKLSNAGLKTLFCTQFWAISNWSLFLPPWRADQESWYSTGCIYH